MSNGEIRQAKREVEQSQEELRHALDGLKSKVSEGAEQVYSVKDKVDVVTDKVKHPKETLRSYAEVVGRKGKDLYFRQKDVLGQKYMDQKDLAIQTWDRVQRNPELKKQVTFGAAGVLALILSSGLFFFLRNKKNKTEMIESIEVVEEFDDSIPIDELTIVTIQEKGDLKSA